MQHRVVQCNAVEEDEVKQLHLTEYNQCLKVIIVFAMVVVVVRMVLLSGTQSLTKGGY